ncbi:ATP-dependent RNA helicase DDX19A-like [Watersipora subatra]|uniref:ATP-dependent RNA helicase DDX19A-like n=1 Tax=Watersipora subatra TaxID=2589382 RepID=UPI00355B9C28
MADDDWGAAAADKLSSLAVAPEKPSKGRGMGRGLTIGPSAPVKPGPMGDAPSTEPEDKELTASDASLLNKILHQKLVTSKADIEVQHKDPKSPLYSVKSFEALHLKPELLKGIYGMGFSFPSKIQESALPALLADPPANMIAQSQSGTGKTAAFVCCMLSRVDASLRYPQCICISPTFELALQTGEVIKKMAKYMAGVSLRMAVRGERVGREEKVEDQIVVGTPGTLLDWCLRFKAIDMQKIRVFVLDEADVMISQQGHQDQSIRLRRALSRDCQLLLFSATYDQAVMTFAQTVIPDPIVIRLRREEESLDNIKQFYISCRSDGEKFDAITNIYGTISIGQSMIFCRTRKAADWLAKEMMAQGHAVAMLTGELEMSQRYSIIERFRDGKEKVLITTNLSARGLDIEQVTIVINYDLPTDKTNTEPDYETYLHRIGRTGRFGKNGIAINFVDGHRTMEILQKIQIHFNKEILKLDASDVDEIEKINE